MVVALVLLGREPAVADLGGRVSPSPSPSSSRTDSRFRVVEVVRADCVFRVGPDADYDRRTPLEPGTRLRITREQDGWLRADLGAGQEGWVKAADVREVVEGAWEANRLRNVLIRPGNGETWVDLQVARRAPYDVVEDAAGGGLTVRLHDTRLMMHEVMQFGATPQVAGASVRQVDATHAELRIRLAPRSLWGWSASYGDLPVSSADPPGHHFADASTLALRLRIRQGPVLLGTGGGSLQGVTVVVDAGHGGEDSGAIGLGGTREKDVNLAVARAFRDRLLARGAQVVMTRQGDETVGDAARDLETRVRIAREGRGHLFVSIHHNARARVEDGRVARGVYVYFYRDQSGDLARALVEPLAKALGEEHRGHVWRSFHVTRQTAMPSVLVEVAFLSNPGEEAKMRQADWAGRVANGLIEGVEVFMKEMRGQ